MNLTETPCESIFSGGKDDNRKHYVSLHYIIMDPSTGFKHAANLYAILKAEEEEATHCLISSGADPTPYFDLIECNGRADHNLGYVGNKIALFALFLVGNKDILVGR